MSIAWYDRDYRGWKIYKTSYGTFYARKITYATEVLSDGCGKYGNEVGDEWIIVTKKSLVSVDYIGDSKYESYDRKNDLKKVIKERELKEAKNETRNTK